MPLPLTQTRQRGLDAYHGWSRGWSHFPTSDYRRLVTAVRKRTVLPTNAAVADATTPPPLPAHECARVPGRRELEAEDDCIGLCAFAFAHGLLSA